MTIKKEPDDNIYCHQAPGYSAKIVKTIPYSIHIDLPVIYKIRCSQTFIGKYLYFSPFPLSVFQVTYYGAGKYL